MARWTLAIALGALSCFTDPPSVVDEGGTTGGECAVGSEGCFCTDGGSCDAGLECIAPAGVCIAIGCTPGAALCECAAQAFCEDGYECVQNFCAPQGGGTVTQGTSDSDDAEGTGSPSTSNGPTTDTSMDTTSGPPDTGSNDVSTDPTDSMGSTTDAPATCGECLDDIRLDECNDDWVKCTGCLTVYDCFHMGNPPEECCGDPMPLMWQAFGLCVDDYCSALCGSVSCV